MMRNQLPASATRCQFHQYFKSSFFVQKFFLRSFYVLTIWVCNFWQKGFGTKAAHKMLVKLTPGGRNWQPISPHLDRGGKYNGDKLFCQFAASSFYSNLRNEKLIRLGREY
jgi:hypothetical protein